MRFLTTPAQAGAPLVFVDHWEQSNAHNTSLLFQVRVAFDCPGCGGFAPTLRSLLTLLFLDQIKPIERLVPVS